MKTQSSEEIVAQCILERFPLAELATEVVKGSKVFSISHSGKLVVKVDRLGAKFFFPTRGPSSMKWSDVLEGGPVQVADMILRDLADAGYEVLSEYGKLIEKSTISIGRFTFCPKCNEMGNIKEVLYGMPSEDYNQEKFVLGGCCISDNDPEIQCTNCNWSGMKEDVRFTKRKSKLMGRLLPTGVPNQGHSVDFEYTGEDKTKKCFMVCECGWRVEIETFQHPWSLIETRVRMRKHMEEMGLKT